MGKEELRRFAVIHNYWNGTVNHLNQLERLMDRFGSDKVGRALQNRENTSKYNGVDPLYDRWEKSRQFA